MYIGNVERRMISMVRDKCGVCRAGSSGRDSSGLLLGMRDSGNRHGLPPRLARNKMLAYEDE